MTGIYRYLQISNQKYIYPAIFLLICFSQCLKSGSSVEEMHQKRGIVLYCAPESLSYDTCNHFNWPINISGYKGARTTDAWWLNPNSYPNFLKMSQKLRITEWKTMTSAHNDKLAIESTNYLGYFCKKMSIVYVKVHPKKCNRSIIKSL